MGAYCTSSPSGEHRAIQFSFVPPAERVSARVGVQAKRSQLFVLLRDRPLKPLQSFTNKDSSASFSPRFKTRLNSPRPVHEGALMRRLDRGTGCGAPAASAQRKPETRGASGPRPTATRGRARGARCDDARHIALRTQARPGASGKQGLHWTSRQNAATERRVANVPRQARHAARRGEERAPLGAPSPRFREGSKAPYPGRRTASREGLGMFAAGRRAV
jgi:hypothetical protein